MIGGISYLTLPMPISRCMRSVSGLSVWTYGPPGRGFRKKGVHSIFMTVTTTCSNCMLECLKNACTGTC